MIDTSLLTTLTTNARPSGAIAFDGKSLEVLVVGEEGNGARLGLVE